MGAARTTLARISVLLAFVAGLIGLIAGMTGHHWKLGPIGWFTGGALLAVIGVFMLLDCPPAPPKS